MESSFILSIIYLLFAIAGAVFPTLANIDFMVQYGPSFDIQKFIQLANINPAAQSLSRDLIVGAGAMTVWIIVESIRLRMKHLWVILLGTFLVSFAFAAPLFLFLRERRLIELDNTVS